MFIIRNGAARKTGMQFDAIYVHDNGKILMYGDYTPDSSRTCPEIDARGKNCAAIIFAGKPVYKIFTKQAEKMRKES